MTHEVNSDDQQLEFLAGFPAFPGVQTMDRVIGRATELVSILEITAERVFSSAIDTARHLRSHVLNTPARQAVAALIHVVSPSNGSKVKND